MSSKILVIGPSWIGDMVMAQSLFKIIKQTHHAARIDVLATAWTFSLLHYMPEVSQVFVNPLLHGELKLATHFKLAKKLRKNAYDQAIVLPNSFKSALIPFLARIPKRTGWLGEFRYGLLNDVRYLNKKKYSLMVERLVALGLSSHTALPSVYPYPNFHVSINQQQNTANKYKINFHGQAILALCIGAQFGGSKRWPANYFAQIANEKLKEVWDVWLFGSKSEHSIADHIMQLTQNRCVNLSGQTQLNESIDLLSLASGVVTNDSGLMHIAAALNKPLVALYGSTSPDFTPPLSSEANILQLNLDCQPCFKRECPLKHHRCMQDLLPEKVLEVIEKWK